MNKETFARRAASTLLSASIIFGGSACAANKQETYSPVEPRTTISDIATPEAIISTPVASQENIVASADGKYTLHDSDGKEVAVDLTKAIGFTPDKDLLISDIKTEQLGQESAEVTRDFQKYLNQDLNGYGPLAGHTDGTNDYNQYKDHQSAPQVPAYSWMIHTGLNVEMPGIGRVEGGTGRAVAILIINRTDKVYRFPDNSVTVEAGFQGWGRIWNGNADQIPETEKRLSNHYLTRMGEGVPETGFIGQTDQGELNADSLTVVSVERTQWGNNSDNTPRYQFRLLRAETVPTIKK
jgi:hypothetical protein